jgi:DNA adenine methylase
VFHLLKHGKNWDSDRQDEGEDFEISEIISKKAERQVLYLPISCQKVGIYHLFGPQIRPKGIIHFSGTIQKIFISSSIIYCPRSRSPTRPIILPLSSMIAPIGRAGGKKNLKKRIVGMFPSGYEKMTYVEPFVGAGHVFYGKEPSEKEVINDKDSTIATIHRGLKKYSKELQGTYPHSRMSWNKWKAMKPKTEKERFMKAYMMTKLSFMKMGTSYSSTDEGRNVQIRDYSERLRDVVVLNKDYKDVVRRYDSPNTLFYFDPPYEESARTAGYTHSVFDINDMKRVLDGIKGKWILSFNDGKHIRELFRGYTITPIKTTYQLPSPRTVTELLISNF